MRAWSLSSVQEPPQGLGTHPEIHHHLGREGTGDQGLEDGDMQGHRRGQRSSSLSLSLCLCWCVFQYVCPVVH